MYVGKESVISGEQKFTKVKGGNTLLKGGRCLCSPSHRGDVSSSGQSGSARGAGKRRQVPAIGSRLAGLAG